MARRVVVLTVLVLSAGGLVGVSSAGAQTLPPTIAVAPFTNLVHRQEVRVAGFGFAPHAQLAISQCKAGVTNEFECDFSTSKFFNANQHGAFKRRFEVRRVMRTGGGETVDCAAAAGACVVGGGYYPSLSAGNVFPLHFDPDAPLPMPAIAVTPSTNLQHLQEVAVTGSGFTPGERVGFSQCDASAADVCSFVSLASEVDADASGGFSTSVKTRRLVRTGSGTLDCGEAPERCLLTATNLDDPIEKATQTLSFDPAGSLPPTTLTVEPATGLVHFQKVAVSGTGFDSDLPDSDAGLVVIQCVAGEDPFAFPNGCASESVSPPQDPELWAIEAWVRRTIVGADGVQVDCAAAPGTCELIAVSYLDPAISGTVPLAFDTSVPPPPPPTAKVRPRKDLRGGQTVTVSGMGYFPGAWIGVTQCKDGATDVNGCDIGNVSYADADENGAFSTTFVVRGKIRVGGEVIRCKAHFGACVVGVGDVRDLQNGEKASAPIGFRQR